MNIGELIFFIASLTGIGFYFGIAYDDRSKSGMAASVPLCKHLFEQFPS